MTLANVLVTLVGFTLGVLIRNSPGAIVAYFVYGFVAPGMLTLLAFSQAWFHDLRPWVDPTHSQDALLEVPSQRSSGASWLSPPGSGSWSRSRSACSPCSAPR